MVFSHMLLKGNHTSPKGIQNILLIRLLDIGDVFLQHLQYGHCVRALPTIGFDSMTIPLGGVQRYVLYGET
jgi:hypothetical protein